MGQDWNLNLRATNHPEFDAWRWNDYWVPLDVVVEFKRGVYEMALTELARFLPRHDHRNRYLRSGMRARDHDSHAERLETAPGGFELPPGATFEPDPQSALQPAAARQQACALAASRLPLAAGGLRRPRATGAGRSRLAGSRSAAAAGASSSTD